MCQLKLVSFLTARSCWFSTWYYLVFRTNSLNPIKGFAKIYRRKLGREMYVCAHSDMCDL